MTEATQGHLPADVLSEYLDGRASASLVEAHLEGCNVCTRELAGLRATRAYLRALPEHAVPRSFMPDIRTGHGPSWWWQWLPAMRVATAAAASLLVVAVGLEASSAGYTRFSPAGAPLRVDTDRPEMESLAPSGFGQGNTRDLAAAATATAGAPRESAPPAVRSAPAGQRMDDRAVGEGTPPAPDTTNLNASRADSPSPPSVQDGYQQEESEVYRPGTVSAALAVLVAALGSTTTILTIRRRKGL